MDPIFISYKPSSFVFLTKSPTATLLLESTLCNSMKYNNPKATEIKHTRTKIKACFHFKLKLFLVIFAPSRIHLEQDLRIQKKVETFIQPQLHLYMFFLRRFSK